MPITATTFATDESTSLGAKLLRMVQHLVGGKQVLSEGVVLVDPADPAAYQAVLAAAPAAAEYGAVVRIPEPGSAAISQPAQSAASAVLLVANAARRGFVIHNAPTSTQALLVAFAGAAAAGAYTKRLLPAETWDRHCGYTGAISGIWEGAGGGHAAVTEES